MNLVELKEELKALVVYDLGKAIEKLSYSLNDQSVLAKESLLQLFKYKNLTKEWSNGLIPREQYSTEQSRIAYSIINLIDSISYDDIRPKPITIIRGKRNKGKNNNGFVIKPDIGKLINLRVQFPFASCNYNIAIGENEKSTEILYKVFSSNSLDFPETDYYNFHYPVLEKNKQLLLNSFPIKKYGIQDNDLVEIKTIKIEKSNLLLFNYIELARLLRASDKILFEVKSLNDSGLPIEYEIEYRVKSITGVDENFYPIYGNVHKLNAKFGNLNRYPLRNSYCFVTDIWHPNIKHDGRYKGIVQVINDFSFSEEGVRKILDIKRILIDDIISIGKMIQYKIYSAKPEPPYPEDPTVAKWVIEFAEDKAIVNKNEEIFIDNSYLIG